MVDYTNIGAVTAIQLFNAKLADVAQKYLKLRKPFDEPCARLDFLDKLEEAEKESERRHGFVKVEEIKIEPGNLDKYANADIFEFLEDQQDYQDKVIEGARTQVILGHTLSYRCKKRGHGISVFIPIAEYTEMKGKKEK